jgi:hypothetical protein
MKEKRGTEKKVITSKILTMNHRHCYSTLGPIGLSTKNDKKRKNNENLINSSGEGENHKREENKF